MAFFARRIPEPDRSAVRALPLRAAPVEVQIMGRGSLDVLRARNVSETGLGVYVPHGFEGIDLAQEVELIVTLPGGVPFLAHGVIKHQTEDEASHARHFGLHFTRVGEKNRAAIARYVKSRVG